MDTAVGGSTAAETVTVRYWAGARAAAGVDHDVLAVDGRVTLADVVRRVLSAHPDAGLARTIAVCSVLVDDRPAGSRDPAEVNVDPGSCVEFLPPFAGG